MKRKRAYLAQILSNIFRGSSCDKYPGQCDWSDFNENRSNPNILYGALVGGPDQNDKYSDKRDDYIANEVTVDYNAGFQSLVAAVKCKFMGTKVGFGVSRPTSNTYM